MIPRTEIDNVKVGQKATVRLVALNRRTTPVLEGEVYYVSADSLPDASASVAQEVYLARVQAAGFRTGEGSRLCSDAGHARRNPRADSGADLLQLSEQADHRHHGKGLQREHDQTRQGASEDAGGAGV